MEMNSSGRITVAEADFVSSGDIVVECAQSANDRILSMHFQDWERGLEVRQDDYI
jgi:hypothetical protein